MRAFAPLVVVLLALLAHLALTGSLREQYRPWARALLALLTAHAAIAFAILARGGFHQAHALWYRLGFLLPAATFTLSLLLLVLSAPAWSPWSWAARRTSTTGLTRRELLRVAAVVPPATIAASGPLGAATAALEPRLRRIELSFPGLPADLDGLRIAQISDVHVGAFVLAEDVAAAAERIQALAPDVFLVTGDLIDDLDQLDATMRALSGVRARLGSFACLGNHEYYAGVNRIRRAYERSDVRLLVDERTRVGELELSGADYPMGRRRDPARFEAHARASLEGRDPARFQLHLLHNPDGWDAARAHGADLTLSGHTHAGQVLAFGLTPASLVYRYPVGHFEQDGRQLHVTSGFGHWMPVRLGCPPEIVLVTLRSGAPRRTA